MSDESRRTQTDAALAAGGGGEPSALAAGSTRVDWDSELAGVPALCLARAARALTSVGHLAQLLLSDDASTLARAIVVIAIELGYVPEPPEPAAPEAG